MTPFDAVTNERGLTVAYLVNQYPKISHSFIRREILALERQGVDVLRLAVRGWDAQLVDAEDIREQERTCYALQGGVWRLVPEALAMALRSPPRFLSALWLALKMGRRSDRPLPYHLVYLAEACWAARRLSTARAGHLHAHFGTNSAEVAMLASALCGVSYSFTVHGADESDKPQFLGLGEKIRRSAFVVAVSSFGRSQMMRWVEQEHWHKVKVVHCGLEPAFFDAPPAAMPDRQRLICVGRLCAEKGQLLLLDALAALAREGIELELVLAGDGEMRPQLEAALARHGLGQRVRIAGWLSSAQVRAEIQASRALVLPSFMEGLPVVVMEAMALRRPVLATYVAGIPELVVHGENGWLFPAGSAEELAAAMRSCLATPSEVLVRMGERARERVLARHDAHREAMRLAGFFRQAAQLTRPAQVLP